MNIFTSARDNNLVPCLQTTLQLFKEREGHNTWIANHEGSIFVIPVGELAQHVLSTICFYTINQFPIYDDMVRKWIPGIGRYDNLVDTKNAIPLTFLEQYCLSELTAELSTSCYAGALLLQAMVSNRVYI